MIWASATPWAGRIVEEIPRGITSLTDQLVTVFRTGDIVLIALAKAALDAEHIRYVVEGEAIQDVIGVGRFPGGYNAVTGPVRIQVTAEGAERAKAALRGIGDD